MIMSPFALVLGTLVSSALMVLFKHNTLSKWFALFLSLSLLVGGLSIAHVSFYGVLPVLDHLSIVMVLLTVVTIPIVVLSTFQTPPHSSRYFYALVFLLEAALLSVFMTRHALVFYMSWEAAIIPAFLMLLGWQSPRSNGVLLKFFLYTFMGGLMMLFGFLALYYYPAGAHSFDFFEMMAYPLPHHWQVALFIPFFIAFAVKLPIFPFHGWQPDTYASASSPTVMLLGGLLSKLGIYGVLRILLPLLPYGSVVWHKGVLVLAVFGLLYAASLALVQKNFKKVLAYSSISHCCLMVIGLFSQSFQGIQGAVILMVAHTINTLGLFFVADLIESRTKTLDVNVLGGIKERFPFIAFTFFVFLLGSIAFPLTNGFVGEFLILWALFSQYPVFSVIACFGFVLGAWYMLNLFQKTMLGKTSLYDTHTIALTPVSWSSTLVIAGLVVLVLVVGIFPKPLLVISESFARTLVTGVMH